MNLNEIDRQVLNKMNHALEPLDDELTKRFEGPEMPLLIILAQPRAGSTVLQQWLATCLNIGYVSNFLARYWGAPYIGSMLEAQLDQKNYRSNWIGHYGNTEGILEPHEWTWFWQKWLKLDKGSDYIRTRSAIDWSKLSSKLGAIQEVKKLPIIFDNVFAGANLIEIYKNIPNIFVVVLRRSPFFICNSIINARLSRHGNIHAHYGNRPRSMTQIQSISDPVEQIVAQVMATEIEIEEIVSRIPSEKTITFTYEEFTSAPNLILSRFENYIARNGVTLLRKNMAKIPQIPSRNDASLINKKYGKQLTEIFVERFPEIEISPSTMSKY